MSRTLGGTVLSILVFAAGAAKAQPDRPLPLDPLTLSERALADSIVPGNVWSQTPLYP